jgi:hypothetical protein
VQLLALRQARLAAQLRSRRGLQADIGRWRNERLSYQFNKHVIHHLFCSTCGIQSFAKGRGPDGSEMVAINARCLDGVDPAALKVKAIDGRSRQSR